MIIAPDTPEIAPARLRAMEAQGLDSALFRAQPPHRLRGGGEGFPRALCRMAESFDALGILYGSLGDEDAETREYYRLLGAALCEMPQSRAAAATARAMNDPVLAPAGDLLPGGTRSGAVPTGSLLAETLCDALVSAGAEDTLHRAAWTLAEGDVTRLAKAWDLVSRRPARIMGLSDRGVLDHGKRADLVILDEVSGRVEATVAGGRLIYSTPEFTARLRPEDDAAQHAAE
jgi:alpha-D-ribose 1-methylphosphonate 5-triphosphate diphosphatase